MNQADEWEPENTPGGGNSMGTPSEGAQDQVWNSGFSLFIFLPLCVYRCHMGPLGCPPSRSVWCYGLGVRPPALKI